MSALTIVAHIKAKQDKIELVRSELLKLIEITRDEAGCIQYDLHQDNKEPAHFFFYENWESHALWQAHMSNQHIKDYLAAVDGSVESFEVSEMSHIA